MIRNTVMEFIPIQMADPTKVNGKTESNMVRVFS
jgi:hypothetical protein